MRDLVVDKGWLTRAQLDELLRPESLTRPQYAAAPPPKGER